MVQIGLRDNAMHGKHGFLFYRTKFGELIQYVIEVIFAYGHYVKLNVVDLLKAKNWEQRAKYTLGYFGSKLIT